MSDLVTENLPLIATAPDGIKRLRGLILELAVRGKLVPQDPNDEPASELLKRIEAEKVRLVKEGRIRKSKAVEPVAADEVPFEVPESWCWTRLAEVALVNPRNDADDQAEVSFVPMAMIGTGFDGKHEQQSRKWKEVKQGFTHFAEGDVGVAKITPCFENSKACVFSGLISGIGAGTTELHIVRPMPGTLLPRYVLAYLKAPMFLLVGETRMTGTAGQQRLPRDFVELNPFPLPPLPEQHRIVARVDELMALCDRLEAEQTDAAEAHAHLVDALLATLTTSRDPAECAANWQRLSEHFDTLFTTEASIAALKQTVLQLAVMGRLVPQDPNDEPASELLKRIEAEKVRLVKEGKIRKPKAVETVREDERPFELPARWEWVRLANVCSQITDGAHHTPTYVREGIPFLSVKDMSSGRLDFADTRFISQEQHAELIKRCHPERDDLLLTKVGTTGIAVLVDTDTPFSIFVSVALLKLPIKIGHFLQMLLNAPVVKAQSDAGTEGVGNKNLVLRKIASFAIPLPPLPEQHRIVAKVDELMTLCDHLQADLKDARASETRIAEALTTV